jgi:hypothetical protein
MAFVSGQDIADGAAITATEKWRASHAKPRPSART